MSSAGTIPVVCALIERGGRVLVAQRPPHKALALKWEFPGGKVEAGESPTTALMREIHEELGCELASLEPLPPSRHDYGSFAIEMLPFVARLADPRVEPVPAEHLAVRWVEPQELAGLDLAAADLPVVRDYLARLAPGGNPAREPS